MDNTKLWNSFLDKIKQELQPMTYDAWFSETKIVKIEDNEITISVPMHVHKKMLSENYNEMISEIFTEITGTNFKFNYLTEDEIEENIKIDTENIGVPSISTFETNLNPNYTFDNFIVGKSNKFAQRAALAVAEQPGKMYNPLFIYGNSGLGKTHLLHAIGNYAIKKNKSKVLYITSEKFVDDFISINKKTDGNNFDSVQLFKKKYRDVDILIIDDIQYLGNGVKTQQEFFNTFNELYDKNKQIIISSDRSVDDLKMLEERLRTRFNWSMNINIEPPEFELRMHIIENKLKSQMLNTDFPKDVQEYIASNCTSDVRKLEGAITRVIAYATMMSGSDITLDLATEALKGYFVNTIVSRNKIEQLQQIVANNYNITVEDLKSKKRVSNISYPRQVAMYICRTYLDESFPKIGIEFGGKDHTTVMHSVEKIRKEINKHPELNAEIEKMMKKMGEN